MKVSDTANDLKIEGNWRNSEVLIVYFYDIASVLEYEAKSYEFFKSNVKITKDTIEIQVYWPTKYGGTSTYRGENKGDGHFVVEEVGYPGIGTLHLRKGLGQLPWECFFEDGHRLHEDQDQLFLEGYASCKWLKEPGALLPLKYGYWFWKIKLIE